MTNQLIWINGQTLPMADARIGVEDRGYQFGDGVYEVVRLYDGRPFALSEHLLRLQRSADAILIPLPMPLSELAGEITRFVDKQRPGESMVYVQLTRGVAHRNHAFPSDARPVLLFYTMPLDRLPAVGGGMGMKILPVPDERWKKCHIKSIALLANVLAKNQALGAGYDEAVFIDDGLVTEGASTNFFAVIDGQLITAPNGPKILPGITRQVLLTLAGDLGIPAIERPLPVEELSRATEMFLTSSTREIMWVSHWETRQISTSAGPVTRKLHKAFREYVGDQLQHAAR